MRLLLLFSVSLLLLTGALGLKTTKDCEKLERISEAIQCYHTAAISAAYLGDIGLAMSICDDIWFKFGEPLDKDNDVRKKADLIKNTCFYDIAKIARDPEICENIGENQDFGTKLFGGEVTQRSCIDETERLTKITPESYYRDNPDNLCAMLFILPPLVLGVLRIRGDRP